MRDYFEQTRLIRSAAKLFSRFTGDGWQGDLADNQTSDLLNSDMTARAEIEFTTRCNLQCVYCSSTQPGWEGDDLDLNYLDQIVQALQERNVLAVGVSGHGETTFVRDWHTHCDKMLDRGLDLFITTNLARPLSDDEVQTLSRFTVIQISCDTVDQKLFKELRRGADLRTVLHNMGRIRAQALLNGSNGPVMWWNVVVSDRSVWGLEKYVAYGLAHGVKHFNFLNFIKPPDYVGDYEIRQIFELPVEELKKISELLSRVLGIIRGNGGSYISNTLIGVLNDRVGGGEPAKTKDADLLHVSKKKPGMTRDCLDPWLFLKICKDSGVRPCCVKMDSVGFLSDGSTLQDIVNNYEMKEYRRGILTGNLRPACVTCANRGWTELETMHLKVRLFKSLGRLLPAIHKSGLLLPLLHWWRR